MVLTVEDTAEGHLYADIRCCVAERADGFPCDVREVDVARQTAVDAVIAIVDVVREPSELEGRRYLVPAVGRRHYLAAHGSAVDAVALLVELMVQLDDAVRTYIII